MTDPVRHITIVGGGTAGWMSAAYLMVHLNRRVTDGQVSVTLIESPNVKTIGVGEATVPAMMNWLRGLGVAESEFIKRCNASFKFGVRFTNWDKDPTSGEARSYVNPFDGMLGDIWGFNSAYHFRQFGPADDRWNYWAYQSPMRELIDQRKGPRPIGAGDFDKTINYAYHLDAGLFAEFLRDIGTQCGVTHLRDDVVDVELDDAGYVAALELERNGRFPVELVIDCTGFRGLIIKQALGVPFEPYERFLLNDRALAVQLPHPDPKQLEPCTSSTALGAGWSWRVPLYSRVGTGYVFSSKFRTDEEAAAEFLEYLGPWADGAEPRALGMRVGRSTKSWEKNCVAIGLSGGFIEPLESTAIYMIDMALQWLADYFPDKSYDSALQRRFNARMQDLTDEIRDFIVLHYHLSNRDDTDYWLAARHDLEVPDSLAENLAVYRHAIPRTEEMDRSYLFGYLTYTIVLFAKGFFDGTTYPADRLVSSSDWETYLGHLDTVRQRLVTELPDQWELLTSIRDRVEAYPDEWPDPSTAPASVL